jgi:hypothetical protein
MFDVFYQGPKPNLFPFEHPAKNLDDAAKLSRTKFFWFIDGNNDYTNFDFNFYPVPWEEDQVHVFSSQWQDNGRTYLAKKPTAHLKQWNWHNTPRVTATDNHVEIVYIDHGNQSDSLVLLNQKYPNMRITRFIDSYLGTLRRIMNSATADYVWVVSSLCDYSAFDFSWHPSQWQQDMLHVFPSNSESKGDTFYVNTKKFKEQAADLELLDWFDTVNYCDDQRVKRLPTPIVEYQGDDLISAIKLHKFQYPYTLFTNQSVDSCPIDYCMWSLKTRSFITVTTSGSVSLVPRDIKTHLTSQIYDYPYIYKQKNTILDDKDLDIIYISNGEPEAEHWYNHLVKTCARPVKRILNINGRSEAYKAAAHASKTEWFFAVFAKLEVVDSFDWAWQPDYLQEPKHYIFYSRNPVNGLEYGHMGVIAYNKQLVLDTDSPGLDFTLSKAHAVIPKVSAIAHYNTTPELTWRTAFREVLKLSDDVAKTGSVESTYRLDTWLTVADGDHAEFSLLGAADAVDYYNKVNGDYTELMRSFEWAWLREYYSSRYSV